MSVLSSVKAKVIRDGIEAEIEIYDIVLDDIIKLNLGSQIVCDSIVVDGTVVKQAGLDEGVAIRAASVST